MNYCHYIVFDFETGSRHPESCEVLQLAAVSINARSLQIGEAFASYIKPNCKWEDLDPEALAKNKIKESDCLNAPDLPSVWRAFTSFVNRFNSKPGSGWTAPIAVGSNIKGFDLIISKRLCEAYGPIDKKDKRQVLFNWLHQIDLLDFLFPWFENSTEVNRFNLDYLREYFGISTTGAHNAIVDVEHTAKIATRFLSFHRNIMQKSKPQFKGAFK